ncbi:ABC transporter permease [Metabacillus idriensis]|uniref:ABC transporter permease n=1 Tax=Metabacillus idriensis TaxID=324768 RepID=UPI00174EB320|nr:ABC transporter permease [Metabacillus idriensis]
MLSILKSDLLKVKRKWFWLLVFLGPFGVIALQMVNYGVRYDYLMKQQPDVWAGLLENINMFVAPALLLGMTILASQIAALEHQQSSWKQLLSLPVKRREVFTSKWIIVCMMIFISSTLLFLGTVLFGISLKFSVHEIPIFAVLKNSYYPFFAGIPVLCLQVWMSIVFSNQAYPLSVGIFGAVFSLAAYAAPDWVPWKWPLLIGAYDPLWYVIAGLITGSILFLAGMTDFVRREVLS